MIRGELDQLHLGDVLEWLKMGRATGRLTLGPPGRRRNMDFLEGRVVFVSSEIPSERLASWLAGKGYAEPETVRRCLAASLLGRRLFTDILLERSVIAPNVLREAVQQLAAVIATHLLMSRRISFSFDNAYPVRDLLGLDLDIDPQHLVFEAARLTDEGDAGPPPEPGPGLPSTPEAFDAFFWTLVRDGMSAGLPADGGELYALRERVREIVSTVGQWLDTASGLVPLPGWQHDRVGRAVAAGEPVPLAGSPHVTWNAMVVACSVRHPGASHPATLAALEEDVGLPGLWRELTRDGTWRRRETPQLDRLTAAIAGGWSRLAAAAAPHLGVDPAAAALAAHLLPVPADMVLWILSSVPMPSGGIQRPLLRLLSRRIGMVLAARSDFPAAIADLFAAREVTPLGLCLHLGRDGLASGMGWLDPVQEADAEELDAFDDAALARAAAAVEQARVQAGDGVGVG